MLRTNTFAGIDFASLICKISKIIIARITQFYSNYAGL
jgi:hypothetical protein